MGGDLSDFEDHEEEVDAAFVRDSVLSLEGLVRLSPAAMSLTRLSLSGERAGFYVDDETSEVVAERFPELEYW